MTIPDAPSAGLFCVPSAGILHVAAGLYSSYPIYFSRKCGHRGLHNVDWTFPLHGPDSSAAFTVVPIHSGSEPRLLGSQRLGFAYCC